MKRIAQPLAPHLAELIRKVAVFTDSSENCATDIPGLNLYRHPAPTAPVSMTYEPSVAFVLQGRKRVILGQTPFIYGQAQFLLTSIDLPVTSQVIEATEERPYLCLRLRLEMSVVRDLLSQNEIRSGAPASQQPAMSTAKSTFELCSAFDRLLALLESPQDIPFLSPLIQREIVYRILQSSVGQRLRAIATVGDQSHRVAKVIAWIKANYAKHLRVEDLAQIAGMSMSTLHHHFRLLTSMSPLQYHQQFRLQAARRHMLTDGLDAASAAFKVGYESASQFNREYSRLFGQPPRRDVHSFLLANPNYLR